MARAPAGLAGEGACRAAELLEALAIFAAAVLTAHLAGAPQGSVDALALAFIVARLLYVACYLADRATLRSLVWLVGLGLSIALFVIGA